LDYNILFILEDMLMFNTSNGYSLSDIAAVSGRNGTGDGMFGENGWWIILLFLFCGWGRGGYGGFGPDGGGGYQVPCATQADVRAAVDQQTLISKLDQQTYGLADSTYALTSALTNGFHGVDNAVCTLGYNMQTGFNNIGHQISDCCCATQRAIDGVNYNLATQACDTRAAIANSTRDIIDANNAGVRSILDFLTQDKIAALTAENQSLKFAASQSAQNAFITANQSAQTAELIRRLETPCPVPAYVVPNPNCCYGNFSFTPFCGCGCGN
jgi:hypothetical protein